MKPRSSLRTLTSSVNYPDYALPCHYVADLDVKNLTEADFTFLRQSVQEYGFMVLKNQDLTLDDLVAWTARWGQPIQLPDGLRFNNFHIEYPEVTRISNILPSGELLTNHNAAEYWHSDGDFWQSPRNYVISFLYAEQVPPYGGETGFADLRNAYQNLSPAQRQKIAGQRVWVAPKHIPDFAGAKPEELPPDAYHDIAYQHLATGKTSLYFGCLAADIEHKSRAEGQALLQELMETVAQPSNCYAHQWQANDLLIWDNTAVMHRSMGGYGNFPRLMYRTQAFANV